MILATTNATLQIFRLVTMLLLILSGAAMLRYYRLRSEMPRAAFVAFALVWISLISEVIENLHQDNFEWFQSPFAFGGAVAVLVGVWSHLRLKVPADHRE